MNTNLENEALIVARRLAIELAAFVDSDVPETLRTTIAARALRDAAEEAYLDAGRTAQNTGLSWQRVADGLGLSGSSSAHFIFGPGRESRLAKLRERTRQFRNPEGPAAEETLPQDGIGVPEAAKRLGVSPATVRRWLETGRLTGRQVPFGRGKPRWVIEEVGPLTSSASSATGMDAPNARVLREFEDTKGLDLASNDTQRNVMSDTLASSSTEQEEVMANERIGYSATEVANMLGISSEALRQRMYRGSFPSVLIGGSRVIPADVVAAVKAGRDPWMAMPEGTENQSPPEYEPN